MELNPELAAQHRTEAERLLAQDFFNMGSVQAQADQQRAYDLLMHADVLDGTNQRSLERIRHRNLAKADVGRQDFPKPSREIKIANVLDQIDAFFRRP